VSSVALEHARQQWEDAHRRFDEAARDPARRDRLLEQLETVSAELRRRLGTTFTLRELAELYESADAWAREPFVDESVPPGWTRDVALVSDAAFHLYARGAIDYRP
jgi:hypothetical protein